MHVSTYVKNKNFKLVYMFSFYNIIMNESEHTQPTPTLTTEATQDAPQYPHETTNACNEV